MNAAEVAAIESTRRLLLQPFHTGANVVVDRAMPAMTAGVVDERRLRAGLGQLRRSLFRHLVRADGIVRRVEQINRPARALGERRELIRLEDRHGDERSGERRFLLEHRGIDRRSAR